MSAVDHRTWTMRLVLAALALVVASPVGASSCIARAHRGAIPYDFDEKSSKMAPADTSQGAPYTDPNDAEVAGIERTRDGQLWVYRIHEFAWKREDVDLRGDCRRAMAP